MSDQPLLYVPVRPGACALALRLFRTPSGRRTSVAFTSSPRLARVLGTEQPWIRLSEPALRGMLKDLGVAGIVIDPAGTMDRPISRTA
ncbi:SseB family protein [Microbispora sp. RL4-1S]|uniref:SseB family protein n=1 Tax=Microbispora oryzae TaxID=2806554 RepID=A0A941AJD4_9ACTN|nr:SAV_915 family protein [Microbispora oryzae]MBP2706195.1 SseB family protein [Microbispora oryzae]